MCEAGRAADSNTQAGAAAVNSESPVGVARNRNIRVFHQVIVGDEVVQFLRLSGGNGGCVPGRDLEALVHLWDHELCPVCCGRDATQIFAGDVRDLTLAFSPGCRRQRFLRGCKRCAVGRSCNTFTGPALDRGACRCPLALGALFEAWPPANVLAIVENLRGGSWQRTPLSSAKALSCIISVVCQLHDTSNYKRACQFYPSGHGQVTPGSPKMTWGYIHAFGKRCLNSSELKSMPTILRSNGIPFSVSSFLD